MAAVYEDNFSYYDLEADPDEPAFFAGLIDFAAIRDDGAMREDPFGYDGVDDLI
jgi:hypothetical protein